MAACGERSGNRLVPMEIGARFGMLTILRRGGIRGRRALWWVRCDCGVEREVPGGGLRRGSYLSCGCMRASNLASGDNARTHGKTGTPEHIVWTGMHGRCENTRNHEYPRYGGRGIRVCERWSGPDGFARFLADVGGKPSSQHSIDRYPDNNGNYEPGNVRWATDTEQANNRRTTYHLTFDGETKTIVEWAKIRGLNPKTIRARLHNHGFSVADALTKTTGRSADAWIQTRSGRAVPVLDPRPECVDLSDIVWSLSFINRFTGHAGVYSVAQHSVLVSRLCAAADARWGLIHDAAESYLGDCSSPLKRHLPRFKKLERLHMRAICDAFGLPHEMPASVHEADMRLLITEARDLMCAPPKPWRIHAVPYEFKVEPWDPSRARDEFLKRAEEVGLTEVSP